MKYYIPTTNLNIDNILSTESISPICYYSKRNFGAKYFEKTPYDINEYNILLYSKIPMLNLESEDIEEFPIAIDIDDDEQLDILNAKTIYNEDDLIVKACTQTIYLTPWNTRLIYFEKETRTQSNIKI